MYRAGPCSGQAKTPCFGPGRRAAGCMAMYNNKTGKGYLKLQLINQREVFSLKFFFSGGLEGNIKKDAFIHIPHLLNFLFSSISLNF
jgi:hypothetical protein